MESIEEVLLQADDHMDKAVEFLQQELHGVRTGKASPSLVENVQVEYYGTATRLRDLAGISTPEPRLIVINPFDPSSIEAIEKAEEHNFGGRSLPLIEADEAARNLAPTEKDVGNTTAELAHGRIEISRRGLDVSGGR